MGTPIWSSGGVVMRRGQDGAELVICHRESEGLWALPKGTPDSDETPEQTAVREVMEETGLEVEITGHVETIKYSFLRQPGDRLRYPDIKPGQAVTFDKEVHFYLMRQIGGDVSSHDHEFDEVRWVDFETARKMLTYDNEVRVVEKAVALFEGPSRGQARH
jgi:8-oxo-dGTP pyrophosphatase MutT (NUDIX family)